MAISFTGSSSEFVATGGSATASGSYTCPGGSNRIMFITVVNYSGADDLTSVSYAGSSATLIGKKGFNTIASPANYTYLYYLVAPTTGSNTLSASRTNTTSELHVMCATYDGASQTGVPDASGTASTDDAATLATSVTTTVANCWTVIAGGSQRNLTASSGVTIRTGSGGQEIIGDSNGNITSAGSTTMTLAISGASSRLTGTVMASFAPASGTTNLKVKAGTYTGNGSTTQGITGIGFQPKVVIVAATTGTGDASSTLFKTANMSTGATGVTGSFGENSLLQTGQIDSLDADGFTVRDQKNLTSTTYYYLALGGTSCVTGTYTGNGTDNRAITGVGFQPRWIGLAGAQLGVTSQHFVHKSTATGSSTDYTQYCTAVADGTNLIQSLDSDGFTIGSSAVVNDSSSTYYYFAVNDYNVTSGTYTGNGSDNRDITGVGFTPTAVITKITSATQGAIRSGQTGDLTSLMRANTAPIADAIQSLSSNTFQIGTNAVVNTNTSTYYWVAFYAGDTAAGPTNLKSLDTNVKANIKSYNTNVIANVKSINTNA